MLRVPTERQGPDRRRISISLDPEVLVEGVILVRLSTVPKRRQADWLRTLLVRGFANECHVVRALAAEVGTGVQAVRRAPRSSGNGIAFEGWGRPGKPPVEPMRKQHPAPSNLPNQIASPAISTKPFAHLRNVVG